jgi:hypothetical protein
MEKTEMTIKSFAVYLNPDRYRATGARVVLAVVLPLATLLSVPLLIPSLATASDKLSVTVYNSDLGVVHEVRELEFKSGIGQLAFRDVPSKIDPTSVGFRTIGARSSVNILEQNYQFDLVSPEKLYDRFIDRNIELISNDGKIHSGKLLTFSSSAVTLQDEHGRIQIVRLNEISNTNLPELPEGLITRPTLFWKYFSTISGKSKCEVSYQTSGISWHAEYVAVLDDAEENIDLSGWSSIDNRSGKTYQDATLKLVAGEINRAQQPQSKRIYRSAMTAQAMDFESGFQEKAFFEYHLYTLPRPSTIANNEIKQLSLFEPASTGVTKEYYFMVDRGEKNAEVKLRFVNSKDAGLGMPLPAGRVRVYKNDSDGSTILLGEDNLRHTPKDEEILLTLGKAFDLVVEETTLARRKITDRVTETDFRIELRNRKDEDVSINVVKYLGKYWKITKTTHDFEKKSASKVQFKIPVKAGEELKVEFTVRQGG